MRRPEQNMRRSALIVLVHACTEGSSDGNQAVGCRGRSPSEWPHSAASQGAALAIFIHSGGGLEGFRVFIGALVAKELIRRWVAREIRRS